MVARWKVDLFLLRPRWRAISVMEDTTQRRTSSPGNKEWRDLCRGISAMAAFFTIRSLSLPGIWKMPLNGGEETRVLDQPEGEDWWNWALVQNGIYFVDLPRRTVTGEANPRPAIVKFFDFTAGEEASIVTLTADKPYYVFGLAVSPDRSSILYDQREYDSTIMLVKNFH